MGFLFRKLLTGGNSGSSGTKECPNDVVGLKDETTRHLCGHELPPVVVSTSSKLQKRRYLVMSLFAKLKSD